MKARGLECWWGQVRNGRTINNVINNSDGHLSYYFMQIAHSVWCLDASQGSPSI